MSRSSPDIRAVQMYLSFGPSILVQCLIAVVAFGLMLSIDPLLAVIAMATMPVISVLGVWMRKAIFPVSWLIQARLARTTTIVDEMATHAPMNRLSTAVQPSARPSRNPPDSIRPTSKNLAPAVEV